MGLEIPDLGHGDLHALMQDNVVHKILLRIMDFVFKRINQENIAWLVRDNISDKVLAELQRRAERIAYKIIDKIMIFIHQDNGSPIQAEDEAEEFATDIIDTGVKEIAEKMSGRVQAEAIADMIMRIVVDTILEHVNEEVGSLLDEDT